MQLKSATTLEHLIAAFIAILKQVPGVGAIIDYRDRIEAIQQARQIDSIELTTAS